MAGEIEIKANSGQIQLNLPVGPELGNRVPLLQECCGFSFLETCEPCMLAYSDIFLLTVNDQNNISEKKIN